MIERINEGVCQWRLTNNQPSFFVNWQENGENQYEFFGMRSSAWTFFLRLKERAEMVTFCDTCGHAEVNHVEGAGCKGHCLCTKAF